MNVPSFACIPLPADVRTFKTVVPVSVVRCLPCGLFIVLVGHAFLRMPVLLLLVYVAVRARAPLLRFVLAFVCFARH